MATSRVFSQLFFVDCLRGKGGTVEHPMLVHQMPSRRAACTRFIARLDSPVDQIAREDLVRWLYAFSRPGGRHDRTNMMMEMVRSLQRLWKRFDPSRETGERRWY